MFVVWWQAGHTITAHIRFEANTAHIELFGHILHLGGYLHWFLHDVDTTGTDKTIGVLFHIVGDFLITENPFALVMKRGQNQLIDTRLVHFLQ
jgi:hypothetical protein